MPQNIQLPAGRRDAELRPDSFDADAYTIDIVWTTGAAVRRYSWFDGEEYDECLSLGEGAVRLDRLNAGAPFVDTHSTYCLDNVIGSVVPGSAKIEGGRGVATILLSRAPGVADTVQKIREGVIRNISVGYWQHRIVKTEADDGTVARWDVVDWEPLEISAVPVPADAGSQIRSEQGGDGEVKTRSCLFETRTPASGPNTPAPKEPTMTSRTPKSPAPKPGKRAAKTPAEVRAAKAAEAEQRRLAARDAEGEDGDDEEDEDKREDESDEAREGEDEDQRDDDADDERDGGDDEDRDDDEDDGEDKRAARPSAARIAADARRAERARIDEITAIAARAGLPKFGKRHVEKETSVKAFRGLLLERMLERQDKRGAPTLGAAGDEHFNAERGGRRSAPNAAQRDMADGEAHWGRVAGKPKKAA